MKTKLFTLVTALITVGLLATASPAFSYWTGSGVGVGSAKTGRLQPPTAVIVPAHASSAVPVSWTAASGVIPPSGYVVTRKSGTTTTPACGSSARNLITTTSCTDLIAADGIFTYTVTSIYRSWTATGTSSDAVAVAVAAKLAFGSSPGDTADGVIIAPAVTVVVQSADGSAVMTSGTPVVLSTGSNPSFGTLGGTLTAFTDSNGIATFADISIDAPGVGYTLVAASGTLAPATSSPFSVTPPALAGIFLGRATPYSALGSAATNTSVSALSGDLGVDPTPYVTGFPDGTVQGETHAGDAIASGAQTDRAAAYADAASRTPTTTFAGDQIGATFTAGVHSTKAAFELSAGGIVTLDGQNDPNAVFIFQIDAALNTAAGSRIELTNGAKASNVFWQANGAVGTGANSFFVGTILAHGAITIGADAKLIGRALGSGALTLASNTIRFTVDLPPAITITGGSSAVASSNAPTFAGTSTAAVGQIVSLLVSGQRLDSTVGADGSWSVTVALLPPGTHTVLVRVRDAAGNAATARQEVTVP